MKINVVPLKVKKTKERRRLLRQRGLNVWTKPNGIFWAEECSGVHWGEPMEVSFSRLFILSFLFDALGLNVFLLSRLCHWQRTKVGWRFRLHWFLNQHVFIYGVVMHMWLFFFVDHEAKLVLSYRVLFEREVWMMLQILDSLSHLISDQLSSIKFWHNTNSCWMLLSNLIIYCPKQELSAF